MMIKEIMVNEVALEKIAKAIFGITSRRYRQMAGEGIVPPVVQGKIDFVAASKAIIGYYRKLAEGQGSLSLTDVRTRKELARAEREELIVRKLKGELVPRNQAIEWLSRIVSEARLRFQGLPRRLAGTLIIKKDEKDIEVELRNEIYHVLQELTKPLYAKSNRGSQKK